MTPTTKLRTIDSRVLDALESLEVIGDEITEWNHGTTLGAQIAEATLYNLYDLQLQVERLETVVSVALETRGHPVPLPEEAS